VIFFAVGNADAAQGEILLRFSKSTDQTAHLNPNVQVIRRFRAKCCNLMSFPHRNKLFFAHAHVIEY